MHTEPNPGSSPVAFRVNGPQGDRMDKKLVYWLEELGAVHRELVGKKCANLGELTQIGMPVPRGFCLSVEAQRLFLEETGVRNKIVALVEHEGAPHDLKQYADMSGRLRELVETTPPPSWLVEEVGTAYERLSRLCGADCAVAVRSAGTESHPGQYETYLNVSGPEAVIAHVLKVWSSALNDRTLAALDRQGLVPRDSPAIGVAVIEIIPARASGVGFTCDPSTGATTHVFLEAAWGLGEAIVAGLINPDRFVVRKETLAIEETYVGDKRLRVVLAATGTVEEETPTELRAIPSLSTPEAIRIAQLAIQLEEHFGRPQDLEWCVSEDGDFPENVFLLQTRPARAAASKRPPDLQQLQREAMRKIQNMLKSN